MAIAPRNRGAGNTTLAALVGLLGGFGGFATGRSRHSRGPYRPHQGAAECARRRRHIETGQLKAANGLHTGAITAGPGAGGLVLADH